MNDFDELFDRSDTNAEKYVLRKRLFGREDVLPMWVADMDIKTPSFVRDAIVRRAEEPIYGYEMMPDSAFEAQITWMKRVHGVTIKREWMSYSPSVVATINLAIQAFTKPGDKVVYQPPVYSPFFKSIANNGRQLVSNPLRRDEVGDYRFDFEDLRAKIDKDTKLLLLCSPHNPVGRVWRREELQELADICLEYDIKVLSDEVHADLVYHPHKHIPFAALDDAVRDITITAIGPGKTFNVAGLSISTLVIANETMRQQFARVYERVHLAEGTVFGHVGFEAAYREGLRWREGLLEHLSNNVGRLESVIKQHQDKIKMRRPEGTYLAWMDCRKMGLSESESRRFFIEKAGLGLSPGVLFGREGQGFIRLNFAVPTAMMQRAVAGLDEALGAF